jgi:hypothetical protein
MVNPPPPAQVQKVALLCASDQPDDLRLFIPMVVPPDQSVLLFSYSQIAPFFCFLILFISGFRHAGGSFLHVCAHFGSAQCASFLLRHGASPNLLDVHFFCTESPFL